MRRSPVRPTPCLYLHEGGKRLLMALEGVKVANERMSGFEEFGHVCFMP